MEENNLYHYYGDIIRGLFMFVGTFMVVSLPFFSNLIHIPVTISILAMLTLAVLGGFLNPVQKTIIIIDTCVSIIGFMAFEYFAVNAYLEMTPVNTLNVYFYWFNQIAAIILFIAVYLCVKTLRGKIIIHKDNIIK